MKTLRSARRTAFVIGFASGAAAALVIGEALWLEAHAQMTEQVPFMSPYGANPDPRNNLASFYVEFRCASNPNNTDPATCVDPVPRTESMPVTWRRGDWGSYGYPYYQVSESVLDDSGGKVIQTFSYAPWRPFTPSHGDGGQQVVIEHGTQARIYATEDGSTNGSLVWFHGPECGLNGWIEADIGQGISGFIPEAGLGGGQWTGRTDTINTTETPYGQPPSECAGQPINNAYDEWTATDISYPFIVSGRLQWRNVPTMVNCHEDANTGITECAYNGHGYGWLRWELWVRPQNNIAPTADIAQRCPVMGLGAPWPGMILADCRTLTQIVAAAPGWSESQNGWSPP